MHTDLEVQVPTVESLALSSVPHLRPGIGHNVAMHASAITVNDKLLSLCPQCPNCCLYAVTVGVAGGGVLSLHSLHFFFLSDHLYFFLR